MVAFSIGDTDSRLGNISCAKKWKNKEKNYEKNEIRKGNEGRKEKKEKGKHGDVV